ncbi:hypothetical protein A8B83_05715 [Rhodobacteraceae bacterium EhC02]|nr:hypothetical protein A8B83_05715 [Rhodobacteraceae bacterium EhC02]
MAQLCQYATALSPSAHLRWGCQILAKSVKTGSRPVAAPDDAVTGAGVGCGAACGFGVADCAMILSCQSP